MGDPHTGTASAIQRKEGAEMERTRRYEFEGEVIEVPLRWDEDAQAYVEDYGNVIEKPIYSPSGRPILLTIEDACPHADMADGGPAGIDCGSCRHYHQFPGSLLGVCGNETRRSGGKPKRTKAKEDTI